MEELVDVETGERLDGVAGALARELLRWDWDWLGLVKDVERLVSRG